MHSNVDTCTWCFYVLVVEMVDIRFVETDIINVDDLVTTEYCPYCILILHVFFPIIML